MPYDPNFPADGVLIESLPFRNQFQGIKALVDAGIPGPAGPAGPEGPVGPPGEVTAADLTTAITGTSNNSNAVGSFGQGADFNYNQPQMQALIDKMDELINALRR